MTSAAAQIIQVKTDPGYLVTDADDMVVGYIAPTPQTVAQEDAGLGVSVQVRLYRVMVAAQPQPLHDEDALNSIVFASRITDLAAVPAEQAVAQLGGCRLTALELS